MLNVYLYCCNPLIFYVFSVHLCKEEQTINIPMTSNMLVASLLSKRSNKFFCSHADRQTCHPAIRHATRPVDVLVECRTTFIVAIGSVPPSRFHVAQLVTAHPERVVKRHSCCRA